MGRLNVSNHAIIDLSAVGSRKQLICINIMYTCLDGRISTWPVHGRNLFEIYTAIKGN